MIYFSYWNLVIEMIPLQNGSTPKDLMKPEHKSFYDYCAWPQAICRLVKEVLLWQIST